MRAIFLLWVNNAHGSSSSILPCLLAVAYTNPGNQFVANLTAGAGGLCLDTWTLVVTEQQQDEDQEEDERHLLTPAAPETADTTNSTHDNPPFIPGCYILSGSGWNGESRIAYLVPHFSVTSRNCRRGIRG